jgi:hypothetical protein
MLFSSREKSPGRNVLRIVWLLSLLAPLPAAAATQGGPLQVPIPLFPPDNWWNLDISAWPVDANSSNYITNFIGANDTLHPDFGGDADPPEIYGFPYVVVDGNQPKKTVQFDYSDESDGVDHDTDTSFPFYPIPDEAITQNKWIEGGYPGNQCVGGDRHMLIVDKTNNHLYELYALCYSGGQWSGGSGAFFDMNTNNRRPEGWTSADAAGLAILPGLVRYDEVFGPDEIDHAFRVTLHDSNGYVYPASHDAGSDPDALPMGARLRLKANTNISGFTPEVQKIFRAMKKYGLIMADNGSDMYISGTYDTRWDNGVLNPAFDAITASDFEVIQLGYNCTVSSPVASNNGPICTGTTLQLTATTQAGSYSWTGPNGFTSTQQNPQIASATAAASGTYRVTVTSGSCTSAAATTVASVSAPPTAVVSGDRRICTGDSAIVQAGLTGQGPWDITWSDGFQQAVSASPATRTVSPGATTAYSVTSVSGAACNGTSSGTATVTVDDTAGCGSFYTIEPCRVVDTRAGQGPALAANTNRSFSVGDQCQIPADAKAVAVNVSVVGPSGAGNLRLFPAGAPLPTASTINFVAGQTRANNALMALGASGQISARCVMPSGTTHFVMDVTGYVR